MTLEQFFHELSCIVNSCHLFDNQMPFLTLQPKQDKILYHLDVLMKISAKPEKDWSIHRKNVNASWKIVLKESKRYESLFEKYRGQDELREVLKIFLGQKISQL